MTTALTVTRPDVADGTRADWHIADNAAAIFTWDNGQAMRAVTVMDTGDGELRVRCIPRTKTGRDHKGHYGHWFALDSLPTGFADALRAAMAPAPAPKVDPAEALDDLFAQGRKVVVAAAKAVEVRATVEPPEGYVAGIRARRAIREGVTDGPDRSVRAWQYMRFVHARQLVKVDGQPARHWPHRVCEVTKVARGTVYYKAWDAPGGATWFAPEDQFADEVLEILADYPDQTEPCTVEDLRDGDAFSADQGQTWHTCAVVGFGTVSVYCDARRGDEAPTRRLALERVEPVWRGVR